MNAPGRIPAASRLLTKRPRPIEMLYTVDAIATLFGRTPVSIYHLLCKRAHELGEPMYCQLYLDNIPSDRKLYRVIPASDLAILARRFPVYVKARMPGSVGRRREPPGTISPIPT